MSGKIILNIGAGHIYREEYSACGDNFIIYLDRSYSKGLSMNIGQVEEACAEYLDTNNGQLVCVGVDIFEFMDHFKFRVDEIYAYRIFEHMEYCCGEIGRLLEACNMLSRKNATLDIIVPNGVTLSALFNMFEDEDKDKYFGTDQGYAMLLLNSEFCNIKADPHASVWSPGLAKEYIVPEGTWKIHEIIDQIKYENRDIYMRILCHKGEGNKVWESDKRTFQERFNKTKDIE